MLKDISPEELLGIQDIVYIDGRSEDEFRDGTIPGAVNVPLFDNKERAEIGTIYAQDSPQNAYSRGLEIASKKLPVLYEQIKAVSDNKPVMIFCWRGGMRSKALATVLDLMGLSVFRLSGGYKAYRNLVLDFFEAEFPFHVVVIRGNTGTGKTDLLKRLKNDGYPVIDLEGLSNNRGSVFGHIGLGSQPTQKQFESLLYQEILSYQNYPYIIVECESKRIGRITLPNTIHSAMQQGTQVLLYDTLPKRVTRIVQEYTAIPGLVQDLEESLERLKKRIGKKTVEELIALLRDSNYEELTERLILEYYDVLYGYPNEDSTDYSYCISNSGEEDGFEKFKTYLDRNFSLNILTKAVKEWPVKV